MPLNKVNAGSNMYDWVTHTHNHLAGACPHRCTYCSTQDMARRFPVMRDRYSGPPRLIEESFKVNYGTGKTIFIENCSDMFAEGIPDEFIWDVLKHCRRYPLNTYVFQTKNPSRVKDFLGWFPLMGKYIIGTTIETNRDYEVSQAPPVKDRGWNIYSMDVAPERKFVTVEPLLKFDLKEFKDVLICAGAPTFYIGADSKNHGLPEPTGGEIWALICALRGAGKKVVLKSNLKRLYQGD